MPGQDLEVAVGVDNGHGGAYRGGSNQTVDQFSHRLASSTACSVEGCGLLVVGGLGADDGCSSEQPSKIGEVPLVRAPASTSMRMGWQVATSSPNSASTRLQTALSVVAEELDPSRRVDEDHLARRARISSRSPFQPDPRR